MGGNGIRRHGRLAGALVLVVILLGSIGVDARPDDLDPMCGDATVDAGESCDDGAANGTAASCCSAACTLRDDGTVCDTGNACVEHAACLAGMCRGAAVTCGACTSCDPGLGCVFVPRQDCSGVGAPARAALDLRRPKKPRGRRLTFQWKADRPFATSALGDPLGSGDYALCVYEPGESAAQLRFAARAPAGGLCGKRPCWRRKGDRIVYRDPTNGSAGVSKILIDGGRGSLTLFGRGVSLALPEIPLATPLTAELRVEGGGCWQLPADAATVEWNERTRFRVQAR